MNFSIHFIKKTDPEWRSDGGTVCDFGRKNHLFSSEMCEGLVVSDVKEPNKGQKRNTFLCGGVALQMFLSSVLIVWAIGHLPTVFFRKQNY